MGHYKMSKKEKEESVFSLSTCLSVAIRDASLGDSVIIFSGSLAQSNLCERNVFVRWRNDGVPDGTKSPLPTAPLANNSSENMSGSMSHLILQGLNQFSAAT